MDRTSLHPVTARRLLARAQEARIAVCGDFCLDAYWSLDTGRLEQSIETGLPVHRIRKQRYSPGGAGNVAVNLSVLGVKTVTALGVAGDDPFGDALLSLLGAAGVETSRVYRKQADWQTCVYAKPYRGATEQSRLDFGAFNVPDGDTLTYMLNELEHVAGMYDVLIINQQIPQSLITQPLIDAVNRLAETRADLKIIVDARHVADRFKRVFLKTNESEAARLAAKLPACQSNATPPMGAALAARLQQYNERPVFITRGERGLIVSDSHGTEEIPGIQVPPPIDSVGSGDMLLACLAAVLATCEEKNAVRKAARLANLAAAVTVKKLETTGTATPAEIVELAKKADYVFRPDLAEEPRQARHIKNTRIEIVHELPKRLDIRHAIFDHDGTLSTLREGWEQVMQPMMLKSILGHRYQTAEKDLFEKATQACRDFIDRTTGIQTLEQMQGLMGLIHQFGCVPENEIQDAHGYKEIYNTALLERVERRLRQLQHGELAPADFEIKNAHEILLALHRRGVTLYLASGTDVQDVIQEARAMGYAALFGDRIFGATGNIEDDAKKRVLTHIIREHHLADGNLVTFGDGPVEIRETLRLGGVTVGVASDEVRRFGLNRTKRRRLIRAGANVIIPDFSQMNALLEFLF